MFTPIGFFAPAGAAGYVTTNLIGYWDANVASSYPGSGTTLYDLAGSNNGTISGPTFQTSAGLSWFSYTGINDTITFASLTNIDSTDFTIQGWFRNDATSTTNWNGDTFTQRSSAGGMAINIANQTGGSRSPSTAYWFGASGTVGGTNTEKYSTNTYTKGAWYFITVRQRLNGSNADINFAVNATIDASYQAGGTYYKSFASRTQRLGYWDTNNGENLGNLDGRIGNCLVYNRLLTDQEISDNFDYQKALYGY